MMYQGQTCPDKNDYQLEPRARTRIKQTSNPLALSGLRSPFGGRADIGGGRMSKVDWANHPPSSSSSSEASSDEKCSELDCISCAR